MGMRFGIFTPTEAGGVGVLYCLIVGKFVYKGLRKEHFVPILRETISGTATVMLIIVSATVFGYYLNWENIPTMLLNAVTSFASNKFLVLLVMNVVLLIVGMFLEGGAALIILAPLMVPIVKAAGIDLVHFGIVWQRQHHDRRSDPAVRLDDVHVCVHHGLQDAGVYQGMCAVYHRAAHCAAAADVHSGHFDADTESHLLRETIA